MDETITLPGSVKVPIASDCASSDILRHTILNPCSSADPEDPLNWSPAKKLSILFLVCFDYFMFTFITTVTVPTFPALQTKFSATYAQINYSVAVPALALAISPLIWTPLAKTYGCRIVMIGGTGIAFIATIGSGCATSYATYMVARFFQGWGVGPASTVGLQVLQDMFFEHERGQRYGYWTLAIDLGLLFGPLIGGFAALVSYKFVAWLTAALFGLLFLLMLAFLSETTYLPHPTPLSPGIDVRSLSSTKSKDDSQMRHSLPWLHLFKTDAAGLRRTPLWETALYVLKFHLYPNVAIPIIFYSWTWYWWVLCVITTLPAAYPTWSPEKQGLLFIGLIIGTLIGEIFFSGSLSDRMVRRLSIQRPRTPEMRLWLFIPAAILSALGLVLFGVTIHFGWHWAVGQVAAAIFAFGIQLGNTTAIVYSTECYPEHNMDITAFYSFHLNLSAFASPFFIVPMVAAWNWAWAFGAQAIIVVVFAAICVPLLIVWGERLRNWSGPVAWGRQS